VTAETPGNVLTLGATRLPGIEWDSTQATQQDRTTITQRGLPPVHPSMTPFINRL